MKYSFVLPAYKATFFKEALDSILTQTYKEFELIIVNDASPEDLDSIVNSYSDARIRYYKNEKNIGGKDLVAQWNHCLEYAQGDYIILASDDDVYHQEYLEKMDVLVNKYTEVNVFRPRVQYIDENGKITGICGCIADKVSWLEYWYYWGHVGSSIGHIIFNRTKLIENGGFVNFPMGWGSDDATILMMGKNGICFESEILYSFRNSGQNISSALNSYNSLVKKVEAREKFYILLKKNLNECQADTALERYYRNVSIENINNIFQSITVHLISQTSFISALRVLPQLINIEYIKPLVALKRIFMNIYK
ncbi:MAG: glycosyltransferase family 2 protein [Bacteroidaceae bacterium]|nr:glycosyltransferase family 2 protein [Bacteroidaceae bacterium]